MRFILLCIILFLSSSSSAKVVDYIAAVVNDNPILYSDIVNYAKLSHIDDLRIARDKLIKKEILLLEAKREGISVSNSELEKAFKVLVKSNNFSSEKDFIEAAKSTGLTKQDILRNLKQQLIIAKLINRNVKSRISITDADVQKACLERSSKPKRQVDYIFIENKHLGKLKSTLLALKSGEPFSKVAHDYSDSSGSLGDVEKGALIKPLDEAVWSTKPGSYSKVKLKTGYYIVFIKGYSNSTCNRNKVRQQLYMRKFQKLFNEYVKKLESNASVKVYF